MRILDAYGFLCSLHLTLRLLVGGRDICQSYTMPVGDQEWNALVVQVLRLADI